MRVYAYYKIAKERIEYKGERFFKVDVNGDTVIQVCKSTGETKRGVAHVFGVYIISRMTFASNYLAMGYAVPITEKEFKKRFEEVLNTLR